MLRVFTSFFFHGKYIWLFRVWFLQTFLQLDLISVYFRNDFLLFFGHFHLKLSLYKIRRDGSSQTLYFFSFELDIRWNELRSLLQPNRLGVDVIPLFWISISLDIAYYRRSLPFEYWSSCYITLHVWSWNRVLLRKEFFQFYIILLIVLPILMSFLYFRGRNILSAWSPFYPIIISVDMTARSHVL